MIRILRVLLVAALFALSVRVSHAQEFTSALSPQFTDGSQRAFPTAEGYGAKAFGGRGGRVIHVTNRNDSGPGSLRDALEVQTGPRTVVFDVGGIIDLSKNIRITNGNVTIAGQTASGGGVCLRGGTIDVQTRDVITRYLCIRRGDGPGSTRAEGDGFGFHHAQDSIVDHLSVSWSIDKSLAVFFPDNQNLTIQYSLFYEPLDGLIDSSQGNHGYGPLFGNGGQQFSFHHNVIAHARRRSPKMANVQDVDVINNIIFNWREVGTYIADQLQREPSRRINVLNNVYRSGDDTVGSALQIYNLDADAQAFFGGNEDYLGNPITDVRNRQKSSDPNALISSQNPRPDDVSITTQTAEQVWKTLLNIVGARVPVLDQVDSLAMEHIRTGEGTLVECVDKENQQDSLLIEPCSIESALGFYPTYQNVSRPTDFDTDGDGMPDDWETAYGLNPYNAADRNEDMIGDGWTNLEYYLNALAGDYRGPTDPATGPTYTVPKTEVAPIIDGENSEYVDAPAISLANSRGNVGTYKLLYDDVALYISASVTDEQLNAIAKEEGRLWEDDSIEIFLDTLHDGGTSRDDADYKFIVNILNTIRDIQGHSATWDGVWASLAIAEGIVNDHIFSDVGYTLEISIPWSTIGIVPMAGQVIGFDLVMNDRDDIGTQEYVAWANLNGGGLNDPDGWGDLVLGEELYTGPVSDPAVNQPLVADISFACVDLNCRFADLSTDADGTVVSWSWNFGDGNGSSAQSPRHSYAAGGIYIVSLTVTDDDGASASDQVTVTVEGSTAVEVSFVSIASEDGWVRETRENSNVGGRVNSRNEGSKALRAGDYRKGPQYKFFVSFDTSSIPDTATIQSATLQLTRGGTSGTNPFTTHGLLYVDIKKGSFGSGAGLQSSDFEAAASGTQLATISNQGGLGAVYTVDISLGGALAHINDAGRTQFRMYFALDDDDDRATDYAGFYSTDNRTSARHPKLIVTYVE